MATGILLGMDLVCFWSTGYAYATRLNRKKPLFGRLQVLCWHYEVSFAARLAAQCPDRDIGTHFEGVESLALRVAVDVGVLPAIA